LRRDGVGSFGGHKHPTGGVSANCPFSWVDPLHLRVFGKTCCFSLEHDLALSQYNASVGKAQSNLGVLFDLVDPEQTLDDRSFVVRSFFVP
jgi:hypothetical protein